MNVDTLYVNVEYGVNMSCTFWFKGVSQSDSWVPDTYQSKLTMQCKKL